MNVKATIKAILIYMLGYVVAIIIISLHDGLDKTNLVQIAHGGIIVYLLVNSFENER